MIRGHEVEGQIQIAVGCIKWSPDKQPGLRSCLLPVPEMWQLAGREGRNVARSLTRKPLTIPHIQAVGCRVEALCGWLLLITSICKVQQ